MKRPKVRSVRVNNHRKALELDTTLGQLDFLFAWFPHPRPGAANPFEHVAPDPDIGREGFSYRLSDGSEGTVHMDTVLWRNRDPDFVRRLLLHELTSAARREVDATPLTKREIARRLDTSPAQLYRLLDPTNDRKSVDSMIRLLQAVGCSVRVSVEREGAPAVGR